MDKTERYRQWKIWLDQERARCRRTWPGMSVRLFNAFSLWNSRRQEEGLPLASFETFASIPFREAAIRNYGRITYQEAKSLIEHPLRSCPPSPLPDVWDPEWDAWAETLPVVWKSL